MHKIYRNKKKLYKTIYNEEINKEISLEQFLSSQPSPQSLSPSHNHSFEIQLLDDGQSIIPIGHDVLSKENTVK